MVRDDVREKAWTRSSCPFVGGPLDGGVLPPYDVLPEAGHLEDGVVLNTRDEWAMVLLGKRGHPGDGHTYAAEKTGWVPSLPQFRMVYQGLENGA